MAQADVIAVAAGLGTTATPVFSGVSVPTATQSLSVLPTGNALTTLSSVNIQGSRISNTTREFLVNIGLTSTTGIGGSTYNKDGVALYAGVKADTNSGDVWAQNLVVQLKPTLGNAINALGIEIDINNSYADYTSLSPVVVGASISGAGTKLSSAALIITGTKQSLGIDPIWTMGLVFAGPSIRDYSIIDMTNSVYAHKIQGSHTYGIDASAGTFLDSAFKSPGFLVGPDGDVVGKNIYIPTSAGPPTGTPTAYTGRVPRIYDTTNNIEWIYSGGSWKQPKTGGVPVIWA